MNDLLQKAKELERKYRKPPETPRDWATRILEGKEEIRNVPDNFLPIVEDHIETYVMKESAFIASLAKRQDRIKALNKIHESQRERVKELVIKMMDKRSA